MGSLGWVKLWRKILADPLYQYLGSQGKILMIVCLLMANRKTRYMVKNGNQYQCNPGQFVTSLEILRTACGKGFKTDKPIRTALKHMQKFRFLTVETSWRGTLITINNWDKYQSENDNEGNGWIRLHRSILKSKEWKKLGPEHKVIMLTCLLSASHTTCDREHKNHKYRCNPGQFITSLESLVTACVSNDVKKHHARTSLVILERLGFLTQSLTQTCSMISIINWDTYQCSHVESVKHEVKGRSKVGQRSVKGRSTNKNVENGKNGENGKNKFVDTGGIDQLGSVPSFQDPECKTPSIQPNRDQSGEKEINANDVKKWFKEGIEKNYPAGSSAMMEWGAKQGKLSKELLRIYGAKTTKKTVLLFCRNWDRIVRDSKMQKGGLPTIEMLWAMRVRVFADVELERNGWRDEYAQVGGVGVL